CAGIGAIAEVGVSDLSLLTAVAGKADAAPFKSAVPDFYLTNPIARASAIMAECSALASGKLPKAAE
ncbi:MAG: hypothetical protein ABWZ80_03155, partial [Beijerinckiaceae bacterium]